jgi:hypothetical protein
MFRHVLRSMLLRSTIAATLIFGLCSLAAAQYGGGGMGGGGMPGSPTYTNRTYSSKGAVIGGVAAGAAVVGGLLYWRHHNRAKLVGCVQGNGKLVSDKDNQTYSLSNPQNETLKSGERVELLGKKAKDETDEPTFEVRKMNKDLGMCTPTSAAK